MEIFIFLVAITTLSYFFYFRVKTIEEASEIINQEKEKFKTMFKEHDSVMLLIDPENGNIVNANNSAVEFYGYSMDELISMNISSINQLSNEEIAKKRKIVVKLGKNKFIFLHKLKNGEIKKVEVTSSPIRINNKTILFSIINDITEKLQYENKLNYEKTKFEALIQNASDAIFILDKKNGCLLNYNNQARIYLGYSDEEMKSLCVFDWDKDIKNSEEYKKIVSYLSYKPITLQRIHTKKDGSTYIAQVNVVIVKDGKYDLIYASVRDITKEEEQNKLLEETLNNIKLSNKVANMGQWKWRLDSNIIETSEEFREIYKINENEIFTDKDLLNLIHKEDREETIKVIEEAFLNKKAGNTTYRITPKGTLKYIKVVWDVVLDENKNASYFNGSAQDITREKELENIILEQNKRFENINKNIPGVVFKFQLNDDGTSCFPYSSDRIYEIYGVTPEEVKNDASKVFEVIHPDDLEKVSKSIEESRNNMTQWSIDYRVDHPIKGEIWLRGLSNPFKKDDKTIVWYGYIYDITEIKQKDKTIQSQEKMVALGDMMRNIAHQWRQPLSNISVSASGLELEKNYGILSEENEKLYLTNIMESTKYLSETIDVFSNFMKDRNEKLISNVKLKDEITSAIHIVSASLNSNKIDINYDLNALEDIYFEMSKGELTEAIINILNNSKDALATNSNNIEKPAIEINSKVENQIATICIEDNAGGIPQDILEKIYEPYFTTKHKSQGTGLGLTMSHKIITKSFNGNLFCKNTSKGAMFCIEIPLDSQF